MFDIDELFTVFDAKPAESKIEDIDLQMFSRKRPNDSSKDTPQKKFKEGNINEESSPLENLPQVQVKQLETPDGCTHEVVLPKSMAFSPLSVDPSSKPAKEYPFTLDPFQKEAVICIENNQSVLVSAHTSAGKTVVAEYAVALSLKRKQRVIYTTPIKALSNQKYREFQDEFKDVGLITGDMTINPNASCLIMTTEILRSMLFRGSEVIREVAWVIFDEIHYMRNKERGVVWEESIIMLPDDVHFVFLSATIPNARQFAEWICHLHKQPCHVVYTEYRPTPLQHYIYPAGGDGIHLIVDENGNFREDNFNSVMSTLKDGENSSSSSSSNKNNQKGRKGGYVKGESSCFKIVKMIQEIKFTPVIIFSFSKRDCEAYADQLLKLDFISDEEKELVAQVYENAIMTISEEDRKLPQVEEIRKYLMKGIGIHHSGLLPIVKELTEILFSENLVKALCATETFAMGLNMPARTVLFTSTRKFDGVDFRWVSSGEYIQMSGRAGRRGLDDKGIVIMMIDEKMTPTNVKQIIMGQSDPLNSAYHITYNMILNTLRVEGINPEFMLEKSFFHFQNYPAVRTLYERMKKAEEDFASVSFDNADELALYYALKKKLEAKCGMILSTMQKPQYILPFLVPGRLVKVLFNEQDFGWAAVINAPKKKPGALRTQEGHYMVDVLLNVEKCSVKYNCYDDIKPCPPEIKGEAQIVPVPLSALTSFSKVRSDYLTKINRSVSRIDGLGIIKKILSNFKDGPPPLDPIEDIGIKDKECIETIKEMKKLQDMIKSLTISKDEKMMASFTQYEARQKVYEEIQSLKAEYRQKKSLLQMEELKRKKRVLRKMKYVDASDIVELKGRVACEISCADELVITELLFNGVFNKITTEELCAVLSCFVFQEKSEMSKLTETLSAHHRQILDTARQVLEVSKEVGLEMNDDEYMDSFKPHMMEVVHAWSKGGSFAKICEMTVIHEGSIVRCIKRLEECLRQIYQAARAMGNADLEIKSSTGRRLIYKDIVFSRGLCI